MVFILIDDDPISNLIHRKIIETTCKDLTPEIIMFSAAGEALEYIAKHQDQDREFTVLVDINMPGMDGWGFLDRLGTPASGSNIYILSSSVAQSDIARAKKYSTVKGYLTKPLSIPTIKGIVQKTGC